jgi:cytochrome c556
MIMRRAFLLLATATLTGCTTMLEAPPPANPQAVVDQRVAIMKGFVGALTDASAFAQGKGGAPGAQAKVAAARAKVERLSDLFPRGTALGDKGVAKSRALTTIFTNRSDFEAKLAAAGQALGGLDSALMRGSKADTTAALNVAKGACLACHNKYRAADD